VQDVVDKIQCEIAESLDDPANDNLQLNDELARLQLAPFRKWQATSTLTLTVDDTAGLYPTSSGLALSYIEPLKRPEYLDDNAIQIPTRSRAIRATELLKSGSPQSRGAIDEYFSVFAAGLEAFRIPVDKFDRQKYDEPMVQSIESFLPYRDEFIGVVSAMARYNSTDGDKLLRRFFEQIIPYMFRPKTLMQYNDWYWDNFKFIIHEMFLYAVGFLLKHERFDIVLQLMSQGHYVGDSLENSREPMRQFGIIRQYMESLEFRNKRLNLNRASLRADMLEKRSHASGLEPFSLM
jgi:hypothetical protein